MEGVSVSGEQPSPYWLAYTFLRWNRDYIESGDERNRTIRIRQLWYHVYDAVGVSNYASAMY